MDRARLETLEDLVDLEVLDHVDHLDNQDSLDPLDRKVYIGVQPLLQIFPQCFFLFSFIYVMH